MAGNAWLQSFRTLPPTPHTALDLARLKSGRCFSRNRNRLSPGTVSNQPFAAPSPGAYDVGPQIPERANCSRPCFRFGSACWVSSRLTQTTTSSPWADTPSLQRRLFALIQRELGCTAPLAILYDSSTPRMLARVLSQGGKPEDWQSLVAINRPIHPTIGPATGRRFFLCTAPKATSCSIVPWLPISAPISPSSAYNPPVSMAVPHRRPLRKCCPPLYRRDPPGTTRMVPTCWEATAWAARWPSKWRSQLIAIRREGGPGRAHRDLQYPRHSLAASVAPAVDQSL